ncbi:hypothetical protein YC2023_010495 [Brassica napus]
MGYGSVSDEGIRRRNYTQPGSVKSKELFHGNVPAKGHLTHHYLSQISASHSQQYPHHFALQSPYHFYDINF